jgi:beta-lactamase regulating signal transducer with metallopeptidase domain/ABC-type branched-subunit amino acid transport system substrate-binding protein
MSLPAISSWFAALASADVLHRLGWVVVHSLWQAAAVAAVLAVVLRLLPRRSAAALQARYVLATAALVALPVACVVTFALVEPRDASAAASAADSAPAASAARGTVILPAAVAVDGSGARPAAPVPVAAPRISARAAVAALAARAAEVLSPWLPWCAAAWLAGATAAAGRLGAGWWLTRRLVAQAIAPDDAGWQSRLDRWKLALGIDRPIRLLASARIDVPLVVGWVEPVVLWPLAALTGLPREQIDAILAHELAHVRRHDVVVNLLQSCIETLFFHHPAAWWISAQVRAEREHCADDLAIRCLEQGRAGSRLSYATALVALEERRHAGVAVAVAADGGSLVDRVERLAGVAPAAGHPARFAAALVTLVMVIGGAASVAGMRPASADEPKVAGFPADTNTIESLTVEQAKKLVKEFPGVTVELQLKGFGPVKLENCLPLNGITKLTPDVAQALAGYSRGPLYLNGLTTLSAEAAKALAQHKGLLFLDGLTTLSAEAATALAQHKHALLLDGLTTLSAEAAKALAQHKGDLSLGGLTTLSAEAATALAQHKGDLSLGGLTTLSAEAAKALAQHKGRYLSLNGLTTLSAEAAKALAQHEDQLYLNGLTTLSAEAAKALAQHKGLLFLDGLTTLSAEAAKALAQRKGDLYLNGLTTLSAEAAKALAQHEDRLYLNGLTTLSAEAAKALAQHEGGLYLNALTTLSAEAAKALAQHKIALYLNGLTTLSDEAATALAQHKGGLSLNGLTTLSDEAVKTLVQRKGWLNLKGLTTLSAEAAKSLVQCEGDLYLNGLTTLSGEAAKALAQHKAALLLNGLNTLSDEAAKALAQHKGLLFLEGLTTLSAEAAKALTQHQGQLHLASNSFSGSLTPDDLYLNGLTALDSPDSVAIAQALATRKGPLSLPNLKKISPKTLTALIEKEDVEIPLIETLELIQEPDGSPTEDFVIPEWLEERQKQRRAGQQAK